MCLENNSPKICAGITVYNPEIDRLSENEYNKLIKDYTSDHRRKLQQRTMNRTEAAGYAQLAGLQRKNTGWNKNLKWNPNSGHWRQK